MLQPQDEIEKWHKERDPWGYESFKDDQHRKQILLSELPSIQYAKVLDIGCGQGFITRDLPGEMVFGVDISHEAIRHAKRLENQRITFQQASIFDLRGRFRETFDLIVLTGVLYPHYIGNALNLVYLIIDKLLGNKGILASVHIDSWYKARFPYLMRSEYYYDYREYIHKLEIYEK